MQVSVLPRMLEVVGSAVEFEDLDGMPMLGVRPFGLSRSSHLLKRAFDVLATSLGLLAVAPVIAAIMVAIRLDSRGPMFFRQVRIGRDGKPFDIFKFRSMVVGADAQKDDLRGMNEVGDGMFKIADDPRVTRVGKLLRRTSLDELPQLFNVLSGEMSLVGPRPLVADEDAQVIGPRPHPAPSHAGHDRPLAGARRSRPDAGDGRDRLPLRGQLVALARREAAAPHGAPRAPSRQRLTAGPQGGVPARGAGAHAGDDDGRERPEDGEPDQGHQQHRVTFATFIMVRPMYPSSAGANAVMSFPAAARTPAEPAPVSVRAMPSGAR